MDGGAPIKSRSNEKTPTPKKIGIPIPKPTFPLSKDVATDIVLREQAKTDSIKKVRKLLFDSESVPELRFKDTLEKFGPEDFLTFVRDLSRYVVDPVMKHIVILLGLKISALNLAARTISARDFIEPFGARAQCQRLFESVPTTTSGFPTARNDTSKCWLCGFTVGDMGKVLEDKAWTTATPNNNFYNAPECEHLLPAGVSMIYLDVPTRDSPITPSLLVNYEWSHKLCNGRKDSLLFVDTFDDKGNLIDPVPSDKRIQDYLVKLAKSDVITNLLKSSGKTYESWIIEQHAFIKSRLTSVTTEITTKRQSYRIANNVSFRGVYEPELQTIIRNANVMYKDLISFLQQKGDTQLPIPRSAIEDNVERLLEQFDVYVSKLSESPLLPKDIIPPFVEDAPAGRRFKDLLVNVLKVQATNPQIINIIDFSGLDKLIDAYQQSLKGLTGNQVLTLLGQQRDLQLSAPEFSEVIRDINAKKYSADPRFCGETGILQDIFTDEQLTEVCSLRGGMRKTFRHRNNGISFGSKKHTYRAASNPYRKRRASDRSGFKASTREDA